MPFDRFLIAPLSTGLQRDVKPWLIPDDAFFELTNAYLFRGRLRKRFGADVMNQTVDDDVAQQYTRLRIKLGTTDGSGNTSGTVPGAIFEIGQQFSIGDEIFTVNATGTPAVMLTTGSSTVHTYNTSNGAYIINGAAATTDVYFYPAEPVMGFTTYEQPSINFEPTYAYDTQFAYEFKTSTGAWDRLGTAVWTGDNSNFFWGTTWRGANSNDRLLFVTNYHAGSTLTDSDPIKYWNGATWTNFTPRFDSAVATSTILTARIILPFKDRLVLLNVVENTGAGPGTNNTYVNRARFSWNGSPVDTTAFYQDVAGKGGYIDAPTPEAIITAEFLKDRLIVFFEKSTWELAYTGNQILPFVWQKINTELGAESTFSVVPFDTVILGVGNVGIHSCNGMNVERIDEKIPDAVFEIHNKEDGVFRVAGIRDYFAEMVYWTFPLLKSATTNVFPTQVLVYNYKTGSWALNDDTITSFGYFQFPSDEDTTWESNNSTWEESEEPWSSPRLQAEFFNVIAGNQEGFTFIINTDSAVNSLSLSITDMTAADNIVTITAINHNLVAGSTDPDADTNGDYILIDNCEGTVTIPDINGSILLVNSVIDANTFTVDTAQALEPFEISGVYKGGGTITRVSQIDILTKQFNPYNKEGKNLTINKIDFLVDKTSNGQVSVDYFPSFSEVSMITDANATNSILGTGVLETSPFALVPLEASQEQLWHPIYLQVSGEAIQLRIYSSDIQMKTPAIVENDFVLHAMTLYTQPLGRLQ